MKYLSSYTQQAINAFSNQVWNNDRFGTNWLAGLDGSLAGDVARLKQIGIRTETIDRYIDGYKKRVSACFAAESRCASSFITGPAKFPVAQQQKRHQSARNRWDDLTSYQQRVMASLERAARRAEKRESGITPLIEAQRNLNQRMRAQAHMKEVNAAIRKGKTDDERTLLLLDMGLSPDHIGRLLEVTPSHCRYKAGYQTWELSNNNAQIVRLRQRVDELKAKEARAEIKRFDEIEFTGGKVQLDYQDDRLRIIYDTKPDAATIASLKRSGFRWSPYNKAWQRQLTNNARYVAGQLLGIKIR